MSDNKLSVHATISRSHRYFCARLKEKGPILSFWLQNGKIDWIRSEPTFDAFNKFYLAFESLTYIPPYRTNTAELEGFQIESFPEIKITLVVTLSDKKGWYHFRLMLDSKDVEMLAIDIRAEEAKNILGNIYRYFLV